MSQVQYTHTGSSGGHLAPHRGGLILALGILSLVVCAPIGIAAWIMGGGDLKAMDEGRMDPSGRSLTQAGKILGIIGLCLLLMGFVVFAIALVIPLLAGARP